MISLPGLNLSSQPPEPQNVPAATVTRQQDLAANTEYRFEVAFNRVLTIKILAGTAEYFGTELAPAATYSFQGTKGAVFTWNGCKLEVAGEAESEYIAEETQMMSYANAHFALEALRDRAAQTGDMGPRVLIVGPENSGKTALARILTSYAVKMERQPMVVNLDPRQGMLSVPGSFTAASFSSILDIEEGWGSSPISGPSRVPVKMPLVYHYGLKDPEDEGKMFKPLITRMALAVTSRMEEDDETKRAGFIIDTPGVISQGKAGAYDNIEHIISEFSVNIILVLSSERLFSDLSRKYSTRANPSSSSSSAEDPISIIRLDKSGGCVDRSEDFMKQLRHAQIRAYFFGNGSSSSGGGTGSGAADLALAPTSLMAEFGELSILEVEEPTPLDSLNNTTATTNNNNIYNPTPTPQTLYHPLPLSSSSSSSPTSLTNSLFAITSASPTDPHPTIRDSSIKGYVYVADVDEAKRKVRLLSPQPGRTPREALVRGRWPESVGGLVG